MKAILVGNGTMGGRHRGRFEACGVSFVGVADNDADFEKIADKLNVTGGTQTVDFAVIASPATTHYRYTKYFLERRIPVFVEKPLATTAEQAQELVDMAAASGTVLFVAQSECFNPIFLNFRKHFVAELNERCADVTDGHGCDTAGNEPCRGVHLEFRREHRYSSRCRDVSVMLDLLVHDLSMFLTLFPSSDVRVESRNESPDGNYAQVKLKVVSGPFAGASADFVVDRESATDLRNITVNFARNGELPSSNYTVSLARYTPEGEIAHVPDSLDNEHRFFLKLLAGACGEWGRRAAQNAADCVRLCCGT
ncbi:Gfo/Idh/MocA family protein [Fibrobacter sp.]|uniref:Gfo/Idh/MocA family protein n=1 Tax=Fibrobacter sp. TaxID=35828 RepID=UPI00388D6597